MSFWNGLKRALGFSHGSEEEEEEDYTSALPTYAVTPPPLPAAPAEEPPAPKPEQKSDETEDDTPADSSLPDDLFDAVIELFNDAQPEFVKTCLSVDAQRAYITGRISESLRKRVAASLTDSSGDEALRHKSELLEAESIRAERLSGENKKLQLSLDRQKRAMLDRINDLEAQVAKLHSDRERFYIDKRNPADAETIAKGSERIAALEAEVAALNAKLDLKPETPQQDEKVAELEKELARQTALREQLEMKSRMSDEMLSEMRNTVAKTRHELEEVTAQREEATQLLHEQIDGFEQVKIRLETRIKELQQKLETEKKEGLEERIAKLNEENASLRHTIENNLYNQANSEMRLRKEIKTLTNRIKELEQTPAAAVASETIQASPEPAPQTAAPRRRGRPKKNRVDAELDNTDWFSSGTKKDDPDFGYHEPPRKPVNDNEAQLSLF